MTALVVVIKWQERILAPSICNTRRSSSLTVRRHRKRLAVLVLRLLDRGLILKLDHPHARIDVGDELRAARSAHLRVVAVEGDAVDSAEAIDDHRRQRTDGLRALAEGRSAIRFLQRHARVVPVFCG